MSRTNFDVMAVAVFVSVILSIPLWAQEGSRDPDLVELLNRMTLKEKVSMVHGEKGSDPDGVPYVGYNAGIKRLSVPALGMQNGGSGAGASFTPKRGRKPATAFPVAAAQASTWNRELLYRLGKALGEEPLAQGRDVLLAPMINIVRVPEGGRNFELFSEDPFLSARCTVAVTKGIQETGVMANAKVITANNQETWRHDYNAIVSERALREIYLPLNGQHEELSGQKNTEQHQMLARRVAMEGAVLLKNDGPVLPLNEHELSRIDVFGDAKTAVVTGGGSSKVVPPYKVSPFEGLQNYLDDDTRVVHRTNPKSAPGGKVGLVYVSRRSSEGGDRNSISLAAESDLITSVSEKYDKTVVMLRTPGAYTMPWLDHADAVFQMWFPGMEEGNAEAPLLFGEVNPSGHLPVTFGKERDDYPATSKNQFPGGNSKFSIRRGFLLAIVISTGKTMNHCIRSVMG